MAHFFFFFLKEILSKRFNETPAGTRRRAKILLNFFLFFEKVSSEQPPETLPQGHHFLPIHMPPINTPSKIPISNPIETFLINNPITNPSTIETANATSLRLRGLLLISAVYLMQ